MPSFERRTVPRELREEVDCRAETSALNIRLSLS